MNCRVRGEATSLRELLVAVSFELRRQGQTASNIDDCLAECLSEVPDHSLQSIDRLHQSLVALSTLCANLSGEIPSSSEIVLDKAALTDGVQLEAIRALVNPREGAVVGPDVSLFS